MNARQKKKAFKKKYGMNPNDALRVIGNVVESINDAIPEIIKAVGDVMIATKEAMEEVGKRIANFETDRGKI